MNSIKSLDSDCRVPALFRKQNSRTFPGPTMNNKYFSVVRFSHLAAPKPFYLFVEFKKKNSRVSRTSQSWEILDWNLKKKFQDFEDLNKPWLVISLKEYTKRVPLVSQGTFSGFDKWNSCKKTYMYKPKLLFCGMIHWQNSVVYVIMKKLHDLTVQCWWVLVILKVLNFLSHTCNYYKVMVLTVMQFPLVILIDKLPVRTTLIPHFTT